ncbi:MAG: hypothetical protein HeimAB125_18830 [Candidatus Heimdallarchaeota archaeon AB_125]|nr:MAG: hypothetical protein HeimAB125_18830 [Candidatus Heimdallarchaeota archaeon AB_125]
MLLNQVTALVVIIGIKDLVRREDIEKKPGYYLVGTIVNLTLSILPDNIRLTSIVNLTSFSYFSS